MAVDMRLESYLMSLDRALGQVPISERADIITEIKSHILTAQEKGQPLDSVLNSMGQPEIVANKYLLEKGLKPLRPSKRPLLKWFALGTLGTIFFIFCVISLIVWKLSPIVAIDSHSVKILGGLIDVNDTSMDADWDQFKASINVGVNGQIRKIEGNRSLVKGEVDSIRIAIVNGKIDITMSTDDKIYWDCKVNAAEDSFYTAMTVGKVFTLDFNKNAFTKCDVALPKGFPTQVSATNGKLHLNSLQNDIDVNVANGKVDITPDSEIKYHYQLNVKNGKVQDFPSSDDTGAVKVKVNLQNGKIDNTQDH